VLPLFGEVAFLGRAFMLGIPGQQFIIRFMNLKLISAGLALTGLLILTALLPVLTALLPAVRDRAAA